jgi:exodeoxyribonuclease VII large subunit
MEFSQSLDTEPDIEIYSVSSLNRLAKAVLEETFSLVWVEGEISNLACPSSGHMYFSLKDAQAQVRCALFRQRNRGLGFVPENGMQVRVQARVSLYEGRGEYQLIVERMEEAGNGALQRAFEALKKKLLAEGLFEVSHKKPLPKLPSCIGVVTSPTGAAIRDIISVLKRRFPSIPVIIYPTAVQGNEAPAQIVKAIKKANERAECDVIIVGRGGGSLEDLWSFNEEIVARAIYDSAIPIVSAVGHEVDITIADFVADHRAATPTAAAEMISPDRIEWQHKVDQYAARLQQNLRAFLNQVSMNLMHLRKRLKHPGQYIRERSQHCDHLEQRLFSLWQSILHRNSNTLNQLIARLQQQNPLHRLKAQQILCHTLYERLQKALQHLSKSKRQEWENASRALNAVSPLNTLSRGYAIASQDTRILKSTQNIKVGDTLHLRLSDGQLDCSVKKIALHSATEADGGN